MQNVAEILFVDAEPRVLAGLRQVVSERRANWTVELVHGAPAALEYLANHGDVDILVADIGTPGTDGATLLDQVRQRFPSTARVVLSGHANRDAIISAAGSAQQFVAMPCDPPTLIATLDSLLAARSLVQDVHLRSLLGGQDTLPKPPAIYAELVALTSRPESTVTEIARLIERDLATTAELLQLVNCSFFGLANEISSVSRAVTLLGLDVIQALVLAGKAFRPTRELPADIVAADIASQGLRACLALRDTDAARGMTEPQIRQLSVGALLRDVALLPLAANQPDSWAVYTRTRTLLPAREAQLCAFGCTIGRASAYLLALWGFHSFTVNALAGQPVELEDGFARVNVSKAALAIAEAHELAARMAASGFTS
jgi:HD-like signal output (HDOD) protein/CheY-like chemotaxis protein